MREFIDTTVLVKRGRKSFIRVLLLRKGWDRKHFLSIEVRRKMGWVVGNHYLERTKVVVGGCEISIVD